MKKPKSAAAIVEEALAEEAATSAADEAPDPDDDGIDDSATVEVLTAVASPDEPEAAAADDADSLLSMFSEVGIETVDRSALLALTPDVEMDDLVTELGLVAAALGIVQAQHLPSEPPYEELAA